MLIPWDVPNSEPESTHEAGQCLLIANTPRGAAAQEHPLSLIANRASLERMKLRFRLPLKELEGRVREQPRGLPIGKSTKHLRSPSPASLSPMTPN